MKFYSQFGEDKFIHENLTKFGLEKDRGTFIDIGAGDPVINSNSLLFEKLGYTVYCIEPNPRQYNKLKETRKHAFSFGISSTQGYQDFYIDQQEADYSGLKRRSGRHYTYFKADFLSLDQFILMRGVTSLDILSIDTEGTELDVLQSFDIIEVKPKVIIVEYTSPHANQEAEITAFFKGLPYKQQLKTNANLIYCLNQKL